MAALPTAPVKIKQKNHRKTPPDLSPEPESQLRPPSPRMPRDSCQGLTGTSRRQGSHEEHLEVVSAARARQTANTEPEQSWQDEGHEPRKGSRGPRVGRGVSTAQVQLKHDAYSLDSDAHLGSLLSYPPLGTQHNRGGWNLDLGKAASSRNHATPSPSRAPGIWLAWTLPQGRNE